MKNIAILFFMITGSIYGNIDCLRWDLALEKRFFSEKEMDSKVMSLIERLEEYDFKIESTNEYSSFKTFLFIYNRQLIMKDQRFIESYENHLKSLVWHLNGRRGISFTCALFAPEPQPRISGSN